VNVIKGNAKLALQAHPWVAESGKSLRCQMFAMQFG